MIISTDVVVENVQKEGLNKLRLRMSAHFMLENTVLSTYCPCLINRLGARKFRVSDAGFGQKQKTWRKCRRAAMHLAKSYASDSDSGDEDAAVDIDALARKLSQEADRLRRTESNKEASTSEPTSSAYAADDPIFGQQVRGSAGYLLKQSYTAERSTNVPAQEVSRQDLYLQAQARQSAFLRSNEGGFVASEFEILQQLGRLSWVISLFLHWLVIIVEVSLEISRYVFYFLLKKALSHRSAGHRKREAESTASCG